MLTYNSQPSSSSHEKRHDGEHPEHHIVSCSRHRVSACKVCLAISKAAVNELVKRFEGAGILREITGKQRYRRYLFRDYVDIIARGTQES
jgi:hypothetical protein